MVSKITILEPHLDGAQFGPASLETAESDDATPESTVDESTNEPAPRSRRGIFFRAGVLAAAFLLGAALFRRLRSSGDAPGGLGDVEIEEYEAEEVSAN